MYDEVRTHLCLNDPFLAYVVHKQIPVVEHIFFFFCKYSSIFRLHIKHATIFVLNMCVCVNAGLDVWTFTCCYFAFIIHTQRATTRCTRIRLKYNRSIILLHRRAAPRSATANKHSTACNRARIKMLVFQIHYGVLKHTVYILYIAYDWLDDICLTL